MSAASLLLPTLLALLAPVAAPPPADAMRDWRWRSRWALAEGLDIARSSRPEGLEFRESLSITRISPGLPPSWRGSTLRLGGSGLVAEARGGDESVLIEPRGPRAPRLLGLARGAAGLLLLAEDEALGGETVLELRYRPAFEYPHRIGHAPRVLDEADARGHAAMAEAGCFACHSLHGRRQVGPSLDRESLVPRLRERLHSPDYERHLAELDAESGWGVARWREAREEVLAAEGEERLRLWMRRHLTEPSFDEPQARMPPPGLSAEALATIVEFLLREPEVESPPEP